MWPTRASGMLQDRAVPAASHPQPRLDLKLHRVPQLALGGPGFWHIPGRTAILLPWMCCGDDLVITAWLALELTQFRRRDTLRQGTQSTKGRRGCDRRKWRVPCWGPKKPGTSGPRGDRSRAPTALSFGWQPGRLLLCPQSPLCATAQRAGSSRIRGCWREGHSPVLGGPMKGLHCSLPPSSLHSRPWSLETPRLPSPPPVHQASLRGTPRLPGNPGHPAWGLW